MTCPLALLLSPPTVPHKWLHRRPKPDLLLPLPPRLSLLIRKGNWLRAPRLAQSQPHIFHSFLRANGMATQTRTLNATLSHLKPRSFLPQVIPSLRKPGFTLSLTQPPHLSIPVHPPVSQFLILPSPKNQPGHTLPGRAVKASKTPLQHKSLRQARVVSPKDSHCSQPHNIVSLPPAPPQPSRIILLL